MTTSINFGECRLCPYIGKLYGRQCWRCRKRAQMQPCADCGRLCAPYATRCLRCSNAYQATLRGRPVNFNHDRIIALFEEGLPISEIAKRIGCTKNTISGYLWRRGCSRRYTGPDTRDRLDALRKAMDIEMAYWDLDLAAGKLYRPALELDEAA